MDEDAANQKKQPEEAGRGENEFEIQKYETRDGVAVRSARGIFAGELFSNVVVRAEPGCASTGRAGGASTAYGSRSTVTTRRGGRTVRGTARRQRSRSAARDSTFGTGIYRSAASADQRRDGPIHHRRRPERIS